MVTQVRRKYRAESVVTVLAVFCAMASAVAAEPGPSNDRPSLQRPEKNDKAPVIRAMVVPAGPHYLSTAAGQGRVPIDMPRDFFFEGSEPTELMVNLEGTPIAEKPARKDRFSWEFAVLIPPGESQSSKDSWGHPIEVDREWRRTAPYDTVMVQFQSAVLPDIGSEVTVDLKLVDIQMNSIAPIEVTGTRLAYFDVSVAITPYHQGEGRFEEMGWMKLTRDGVATGYFTSEVFGWARFTFTPVNGGEAIIYDHDELLTLGTNEPTPFLIASMLPVGSFRVEDVVNRCCNVGSMCRIDCVEGECCTWHCP